MTRNLFLITVSFVMLAGSFSAGAGILAQSISKPLALTMTAPFASHSWTLILPFTSSNAM
jgi:tRNA A37 threonylcarbamoyladenosine biosynthesis protein TsaE